MKADNRNQSFFKTNSVFDFSGNVGNVPKVSNFTTLKNNIKDLALNKNLDDVEEFSARASESLNRFSAETQQQADFITDDNDFSLNDFSGAGARLERFRSRQATELDNAFSESLALVQSRQNRREKKEEIERLDAKTDLELQLKAASIGVENPAGLGRKELINKISAKTIELSKKKSATGGGVATGYTIGSAADFYDTGTDGGPNINADGKLVVDPFAAGFDFLNQRGLVQNQSIAPVSTPIQGISGFSSVPPTQQSVPQNQSKAPIQSTIRQDVNQSRI